MSAYGHGTGTIAPLYARDPKRVPVSLLIFAIGSATMAIALVLTLLGVPAALFYDEDGPGKLNQNDSWDMVAMSRSIDLNMKYIKEGTDSDPDSYNGLQTSISKSEDAVPLLAKGVEELDTAVVSLDRRLTGVHKTTVQMRADMAAMALISRHSGETMRGLGTDIDSLASAMSSMYWATSQLTKSMAGIEAGAKTIATRRTNRALSQTQQLNDVLPNEVPEATTTLRPDRDIRLPYAPQAYVPGVEGPQ